MYATVAHVLSLPLQQLQGQVECKIQNKIFLECVLKKLKKKVSDIKKLLNKNFKRNILR